MTSIELPWLLVHGTWLWKAVLVAFVLLCVALFLAVRRLLGRGELKLARERMRRVQAPDEVGGVLHRATASHGAPRALATTLSAEPDTMARPSSWVDLGAEELVLHADDGRQIQIAGPLRVLAGTSAVTQRHGVPAELGDAELAAATEQIPWLHRPHPTRSDVRQTWLQRLYEGDAVTLRGRLVRSPGTGERGFRDSEDAWTLQPEEGAIAALARKPVAPRTRKPVVQIIIVTVLSGLAGRGIEQAVGKGWISDCSRLHGAALGMNDDVVRQPAFDSSHPCIKAAAAPGRRELALSWMTGLLERAPRTDELALERVLAMTRMTEGCAASIKLLTGLQRYREASELAHRCGERRLEHQALVAQGRYAEAIALPVAASEREAALPLLSTRIAAGQWKEAAAELDAMAANLPPDDDADRRELTRVYHQCQAALARHHGGDAQALATMRALRASRHGQPCAPMLYLVTGSADVPRPADATGAMADELSLSPATWVLEQLQVAAGVADDRTYFGVEPEEFLANPTRTIGPSWIGLVWLTGSAPALPTEPLARVHFLRWRAMGQVFDDELAAAEQSAQEVLALSAGLKVDDFALRWRPNLLPALRLYSPRVDLGVPDEPTSGSPEDAKLLRDNWLFRFARLLVREGKSLDGTYLGPAKELVTAIEQAQRGDGVQLARYMVGEPYHTSWWHDDDILAVLPRVKTGREEVRHALIWNASAGWRTDTVPISTAVHAFLRREVLQLAGAEAEAARWEEIYRRVDDVLGDRKRLVSLLLLDR